MLDKSAMSYQVVLTKYDEVKVSERGTRVASVEAALAKHPAAYPQVIFTSSETGFGIETLRGSVAQLLDERGYLQAAPI